MRKLIPTLVVLTMLLVPPIAMAEGDRPERGHPPGKPPKEAVDACLDLTESDPCSVTTPRGDQLTGSCRVPPREAILVCIPEDHGSGHGPRPNSGAEEQ
jgi:hypothetical protein